MEWKNVEKDDNSQVEFPIKTNKVHLLFSQFLSIVYPYSFTHCNHNK